MNSSSAFAAYKQVDTGAAVAAATPHELVSLLMAGALKRVMEAKGAIARNDSSSRGMAISKAISIVGELQGSLRDTDKNEVAQSLDQLYGYMTQTLVKANAEASEDKLQEVGELLMQIKEGWDGIAPRSTTV